MKHIKKSFSFSMPGKEITLEDHRGNSSLAGPRSVTPSHKQHSRRSQGARGRNNWIDSSTGAKSPRYSTGGATESSRSAAVVDQSTPTASLEGTGPSPSPDTGDREEPYRVVKEANRPGRYRNMPTPRAASTSSLEAAHEARVLVVGKGVLLSATVTSCDKVIVEGLFKGTITTGVFVLAEGGQMEGEVECEEGRIGGHMKATIVASKALMIGRRAMVHGDVVYESLEILDGGRLQGQLMHFSSRKPKPAAAPDEDESSEVAQELTPEVTEETEA